MCYAVKLECLVGSHGVCFKLRETGKASQWPWQAMVEFCGGGVATAELRCWGVAMAASLRVWWRLGEMRTNKCWKCQRCIHCFRSCDRQPNKSN